ncbi:MAG: acyl-CoA dehydrogenase family protein [Anaerolineaceae bacterium]|nr:acyl-CoA dehydrogenase family protein [Anaerolineaceae bacterium]
MDFSFPPHVEELAHKVRRFVETEVIPHENDYHHGTDEAAFWEVIQGLRAKARTAGLYLPQLPPELGGLGLSLMEIIPVFEATGRSMLGPIALNCSAPDEGNMHLLHLFGTEEQKERYLKPLAAGTIRSAFSMTEPPPGAGSDPTMMRTTAVRDGDEWVINGRKWYSTGGDGAAFFIIAAVTNPDVPATKGTTLFIAPAGTPGVNHVRRVPVMTGYMLGGHSEMQYTDLRLPHSAILGEEGQGFALMQARLGPARLTHCMRWTGVAQRALEIATKFATEREAFGGTLSTHQSIQWMLADSAIDLHAGRLMIYQAGWLLSQGEQARQETSMCKVFVAEAVNRVIDRALQITGGMGISGDMPIGDWFREARAFRIYDGASEVHRMVVGRRVIKQFGS